MEKKTILWMVLDLIFLVVFNIVFFVLGGTVHPASVWIAYTFIHLAYILLLIIPFLVKEGINEAVFGFPLYMISSVYFFLEFVVGIVFVILGQETYKYSLVVQIIMAGIYAAVLVSCMIANEKTAEEDEIREDEVQYIKDVCYELQRFINRAEDTVLKKKLEKAYDIIHSSPVASNEDARETEDKIFQMLDTIAAALNSGNVDGAIACVEEILELAEIRNRQVKMR